MNLYHQHLASEQSDAPSLILIPGLFGSTSNLRGIASKLCQNFEVYVIDQRNHGRSAHADSHSYFDMAQDLLEFVDFHALDSVILCGHSMGGKTAMLFSLLHPERISKLIVLDIAPVSYAHSHAPFLEQLMHLDLSTIKSRREADVALQSAIEDTATRLFLLQNLTGSPGDYHWRINLEVLHRFMPELVSFPTEEISSASLRLPSKVKSAFVYAANSHYVLEEYRPSIEGYFSAPSYIKIDNAGHWLHAEQPQAIVKAIEEFSFL